MTEQTEVDAGLIALYLEEHGVTPLPQLIRELGSAVRTVVAVGELVRQGSVRVIEQNHSTITVEPGQERTVGHEEIRSREWVIAA